MSWRVIKKCPQKSPETQILSDINIQATRTQEATHTHTSPTMSGCYNIAACHGMEDILQYIAETCSGVKEVDVTACSYETVLRGVATRARIALGAADSATAFERESSCQYHPSASRRHCLSETTALAQNPPSPRAPRPIGHMLSICRLVIFVVKLASVSPAAGRFPSLSLPRISQLPL